MASIAARQVAREVVGLVGKGTRPNITSIAVKNGYSYKTANAGKVQETKTYKAEIASYVEKLERERNRLIEAMSGKDLSRERYDTLSQSTARLTHDIQLLSGKSTDNVAVNDGKNILLEIVKELRGGSDTSLTRGQADGSA